MKKIVTIESIMEWVENNRPNLEVLNMETRPSGNRTQKYVLIGYREYPTIEPRWYKWTHIMNGMGKPRVTKNGDIIIHSSVKKDTKKFNKELYEMYGDRIICLDEYVNANTKLRFLNSECGHEFENTPHTILGKYIVCPKCNTYSLGEMIIKNILLENNIVFETQKTFEDLKLIKKLRYDFYIPSKNILIEFQGKQHFKDTKSMIHEYESYEKISLKDDMKRVYAAMSDIKLIEITYKDVVKGKLKKDVVDKLLCEIMKI